MMNWCQLSIQLVVYVLLLIQYMFVLQANAAIQLSGGTTSTENAFPEVVSLQYQNSPGVAPNHFCGAGILNSKYLITAAHCVQGLCAIYFTSLLIFHYNIVRCQYFKFGCCCWYFK